MTTELLTAGRIADMLNEPFPRVAYVIAKLRIKPVTRVGIIRLFDGNQIELISSELNNIQIRSLK